MTKARVNEWFDRRMANMRIATGSWMKWSFLGMALLSVGALCGPVHSQSAPSVRAGAVDIKDIPEDWSHHYAVFSDPGSEQDALRNNRYEQWQNVVNNPRYVIQQLKRNARVQGPGSLDADYRYRQILEDARYRSSVERARWSRGLSGIKKDWSQSLGGTGLADGHYPAKYPFLSTTASCSDYVVYPTGAAGSGAQATIMAFNNLYVGTGADSCGSTNPTVYWAYNTGTGAVANLSPTLSLDGTQVAFIQVSSGGVASLVVLKMANSGGARNAPTFGSGSGSVTAANYRACTAPCFTAIALNGNPNDAASAPFYNYDTDNLYVGDSSGKVHLFTGVFSGTPAETTTNWPVTASTNTPATLTSPIYDSGSNRIFVTDQAGYLHTFAVTSPPGSVSTSGRLENNTTHVFEPPIVDGTTEEVYTFIGYSGDGGNNNPSYINVFPAAALGMVTTGAGSGFGTGVNFPNGGTSNPTTSHMRAGDFDYQYYIGSGTTGNIYTCENGTVYQIPLATITTPTVHVYNTPVRTVGIASACAPVTEFQSVSTATTINSTGVTSAAQTKIPVASDSGMSTTAPNNYLLVGSEIMKITAVAANSVTVTRASLGTTAGSSYPSGTAAQVIQDWMFTSVEANSTVGTCTAASGCLLNYSVLGASTTGTPTTGFPAAGGTSGIVIDNQVPVASQVGAEQIYYNLLSGTT
ncbi:MAG TPA: hypothetical protein VHX49_11650, partial [Candidatus Acidoferrales bacterium]|nr:hypothetical protein [Candidatus Acidoferrales bacterium]